jgi:5-methyltetrahydrofolate--homocysteine methyltransferase
MGDAFPHVRNNFGPGVMATYIGGRGHAEPEGGTVWFGPAEEHAIEDLRFSPNHDAAWFVRMASIYRAAVERWQGAVQVGMTDLGGNLDVLSTFRPGEKLLLDLYDTPDEVKRLTWEAHEAWWHFFDAFNDIIHPPNPGYTCWAPIFSKDPYYMLQCDFCYMIGPDMFDEFVKPELAASCERLTNPFYHLDGPGQLPHLDSLLEIEALKGVQWVPGAGQPEVTEWPGVYRRIREAGKLIQTWGHVDVLDRHVEQLGSAKGIIIFAGCDVSERNKAVEFLEKYNVPVE